MEEAPGAHQHQRYPLSWLFLQRRMAAVPNGFPHVPLSTPGIWVRSQGQDLSHGPWWPLLLSPMQLYETCPPAERREGTSLAVAEPPQPGTDGKAPCTETLLQSNEAEQQKYVSTGDGVILGSCGVAWVLLLHGDVCPSFLLLLPFAPPLRTHPIQKPGTHSWAL